MSMYDIVFNPSTELGESLLGMLGFKRPSDVGRYRDSWIEKDEKDEFRVAVYTRNGGGNREHFSNEGDPGADCGCTGCVIEYVLPKHPLYLFDRDDEFDSTYATVYFRFPEPILDNSELMEAFEEGAVEPVDMSEKWHAAIDRIGS